MEYFPHGIGTNLWRRGRGSYPNEIKETADDYEIWAEGTLDNGLNFSVVASSRYSASLAIFVEDINISASNYAVNKDGWKKYKGPEEFMHEKGLKLFLVLLNVQKNLLLDDQARAQTELDHLQKIQDKFKAACPVAEG